MNKEENISKIYTIIVGAFKKLNDMSLSNRLSILAISVSILSCRYTYKTAEYTKEANEISTTQTIIADQQKEIMQQQTDILDRQIEIQEQGLQFEKDKHYSDTAKEYLEKMNNLFDDITRKDPTLTVVHEKLKGGETIKELRNLDRYVDSFEEIGGLYCDYKIRFSDLKRTLGEIMKVTCGSSQIYNRYQNTKSGISGICKTLFPKSTVMATYANEGKCLILKK